MAVFVGGEDKDVPGAVPHISTEKTAARRRDSSVLHMSRRAGDPQASVPSRHVKAPVGSRQIVACLDVRAMARRPLGEHESALIQAVALRRLQRAIRPGDRVCMSGGSRLAVCFGAVADGVDPARLGERMAAALGDRLTLDEESIDLYVSVGIAAGPASLEQSELIATAMRQLKRQTEQVRNGDPVSTSLTVTEVAELAPAGQSAQRGSDSNGHRTVTLMRRDVDSANGNGTAPAGSPGATAALAATEDDAVALALVVDSLPPTPGTPGVTANAVGACLGGLGVRAEVHAPAHDGDLYGEAATEQASPASLVFLVVHPSAQPQTAADGSREWELPAAMCRAYHRAGSHVAVVSIGATSAALAGCIEQGALGVLDIENLPQHGVELAAHFKSLDGDPDLATLARMSWPRIRGLDSSRFEALMQLTPSERKVLYHLTTGASASQIASLLVVSIATVRSHIRSILRKLDVGSQLAAVAIARGEHSPHPAEH